MHYKGASFMRYKGASFMRYKGASGLPRAAQSIAGNKCERGCMHANACIDRMAYLCMRRAKVNITPSL